MMVVIDSKGSSPGRPGFKMAVADDDKMTGSIGGGVMEFNMVERAKGLFDNDNGIFIVHQNHNSDSKSDSSGMICSGSQIIAFYPLNKTHHAIINSIENADGGRITFDESGIHFFEEMDSEIDIQTDIKSDRWLLTENIGYKNNLYIFGGGHVSVAVSMLFKQLGFHVTVLDNRDEQLTTFQDNTFANSKKIIDYGESANYVPEGDNTYVVIMTFACKSDGKVLKHLVNKNVKYLGMMGSKEKVSTIFQKLRGEGISEQQLAVIDSPIGFAINSQTPMEIAVSLAAKVISIKNA